MATKNSTARNSAADAAPVEGKKSGDTPPKARGFIPDDVLAARAVDATVEAERLAEAKLAESGIAWNIAKKRFGLVALTADQVRTKGHARRPAILIPYFDLNGAPLIVNGKLMYRLRYLGALPPGTPKYVQPAAAGTAAYIPPGEDWQKIVADQDIPINITEGEFKAMASVLAGVKMIGLGGVWNFKSKALDVAFLPELEAITWAKRRTTIIYDSDTSTNPDVKTALRMLASILHDRGAGVFHVTLPHLGGKKTGVDDFLVHHGKDGPKELQRLIEAAKEMPHELNALIAEFNTRYAFVNENGEPIIYEPVHNKFMKRDEYVKSSFAGFKQFYANRTVMVNGECVNAANIWFKHEDRRQYLGGVVFDPTGTMVEFDQLNLWRGFAYDPKPGSWDLMRAHIRDVICNGDLVADDFLVKTLARMVQFPAERGEVAIIIKGEEGTGKGALANAMVKLFGQHGFKLSNPEQLVGKFNAHLQDTVVVFADEALYAGDKKHVGVVKAIITEEVLTVEDKFKRAANVRNCLHLIMASNEDWVIAAGLRSRRFLVLNVPDTKLGDRAYFDAMFHELENGGYEAMLYDLLAMDLIGFDHRTIPVTTGLVEQRKRSSLFDQWWEDVLHRGYVCGTGQSNTLKRWFRVVPFEMLYNSYIEFAKADSTKRRAQGREDLGKRLSVFGYEKCQPRNVVVGESRDGLFDERDRAWANSVGTLSEARAAADKTWGGRTEWDVDEDDHSIEGEAPRTPDQMMKRVAADPGAKVIRMAKAATVKF